MSARSRIGFRGAALEPHHAPPQRHRDRCAGLPTVRTYSRRDRRGSAEHQRVADFTARRAASGRSGPVRYHQVGPVLADHLWRCPRSWSTSRWMTASSIWSRKVSILPFGSENSRTRAWLCGALRRFGSCSAPLPTMSNNMACRESRRIPQTIDACSTASAPSPANGVSRARFRSNNGNMLHAAMLAGAGVGFVPTFVAGRNLAEGRLISLMPDYQPVESELSVIYPP